MYLIAHSRTRAFSLVELSIVLVILGLLVGGVLAGQSLIRAAELRAVTTEYARFTTARQSFRDKYFALPGDMNNATQFWGRQNSNADCVTNSSAAVNASAGTCDGNGDGQIAWAAAASQSGEFLQYWRQLAFAGQIEGSYTGLAAGCNFCMPASAAPKSKLTNGYWNPIYLGTQSGNPQWYDANYGSVLFMGAIASYASSPVLKPEEAWNIDTKLDDGKPTTGKVFSWKSSINAGCTTADTAGAAYKLDTSGISCSLIFSE
jgi:prepilin-type N-terminal cleavage/methylation domain-containing protein